MPRLGRYSLASFLSLFEQFDRLTNPPLSSLISLRFLNPLNILFLMGVRKLLEERLRFRITFQCLPHILGDGNLSRLSIFFYLNIYLIPKGSAYLLTNFFAHP